ncbi:MAG: hypothetical protein K5872_06200 [Rhizobiaceae bacterium]|nr:hypothetical protein [Rhizobiaceae bacterium]MCV0405805.1 hypothetical protein [Rhizobiaceae bacterium]
MSASFARQLTSAACSAALAIGMASAPAFAQDTPKSLSLELNNARDANGGCRITYIAKNDGDQQYDTVSYQIVVFDNEDKVAQFLILEFGRLAAGKTKVVEFDFANRECGGISRILVNDVSECTVNGSEASDCLDRLATSSRTGIEFGV